MGFPSKSSGVNGSLGVIESVGVIVISGFKGLSVAAKDVDGTLGDVVSGSDSSRKSGVSESTGSASQSVNLGGIPKATHLASMSSRTFVSLSSSVLSSTSTTCFFSMIS